MQQLKFPYYFLFLCIFLTVIQSACKDTEEDFVFEIPYQMSFTVPAGLNRFVVHPITPHDLWYDNRLQAELQQRGMSMADVQEVRPGFASLQIVGTQADFNFLREVTINVNDPDADDGRPNVELFYLDAERLRDAGRYIELIPGLADAKGEMDEAEFGLRMVLSPLFSNAQTFEVELNFTLQVR